MRLVGIALHQVDKFVDQHLPEIVVVTPENDKPFIRICNAAIDVADIHGSVMRKSLRSLDKGEPDFGS